MNIKDIINKKRLKQTLTKEEIEYVINGFVNEDIKDYQMSALLMAITINGMTFEETLNLTDSMLRSGDILDLSNIDGIVVDKHSTGGIGDKVTLVLSPLLASLGIKVAKMSGRGLGYTGGTIDKIESIPGFNVNLKEEEFINQVNSINIALTSPTANLDLADKKIYALRDVTATVESIPLIASSIMSKKLASNAAIIVIDVKVGCGALMKNKTDAIKLAHYLIKIGKHYNKKVFCLLTNMNQPLGKAIGNKLEVIESIDALNGKGCNDLMEVVYAIASIIVSEAKKINVDEAFKLCVSNIKNGKAYEKFVEFVKTQKGSIDNLKCNCQKVAVISDKSGYINNIDAEKIGKLSLALGAGRMTKENKINYDVGIVLNKKIGDYITKGDILGKIYYDSKKVSIDDFKSCFSFTEEVPDRIETIYGLIKM